MVQRKMTFRVDTTSIQGEGSWVELGYMTWGEMQAAFSGEFKTDAILEKYVIAWNWVDEDGKDLELSVDVLFDPERKFLVEHLFEPDKADSKN